MTIAQLAQKYCGPVEDWTHFLEFIEPIRETVRVLTLGKKIHGPDAWRSRPWRYYARKAQGHLTALMAGHSHELESGLHEAAHVAANSLLIMACWAREVVAPK